MKVYVVALVCAAVFGFRSAGAVSPEDARIIAAVSTWTQLSFFTSTTTIPYTCALSINPIACKRRNLRQFKAMSSDKFSNIAGLDSSLTSDDPFSDPIGDKAVSGAAAGGDRKEKLAITVWSSATSTYTMLMTATDTGVTFSLSFYCSVMGANYPPICPGR